ncbi:MAG: GntR family transcriptional regulator [Anaerotruncus sp.]|nr:GntR family transcriptional regulator [Anaerotruncus sp.]
MRRGEILPGSAIDMEETSKKLGVSKTPLRDALLQLEMEDFVTIMPRRMIVVNALGERGRPELLRDHRRPGEHGPAQGLRPAQALGRRQYANPQRRHAGGHRGRRLRLLLREEPGLPQHLPQPLRQREPGQDGQQPEEAALRLPRPAGFVKEWEESSILEHQALIDLIRSGRSQAAANHIRDIHWSFRVQERFIREYYPGISGPAE